MFGALMPKEGKYFDHFNAHGALVAQGGSTLRQLIDVLSNGAEEGKAQALADEIDRLESEADKITHEVLAHLHSAFITPFDRDEIHELINGMDNILDMTQDVAEAMALYDIHRIPAEARAMAEITERSCQKVTELVKLLRNMDNGPSILKLCHEINEMESEVDRMLRVSMSRIFREEPDVREVIKLKEIYQLLESVTDRCKDVAGTVEAIVLENS
jgi:predicted phosphate transport protein (TIGR00153 family)